MNKNVIINMCILINNKNWRVYHIWRVYLTTIKYNSFIFYYIILYHTFHITLNNLINVFIYIQIIHKLHYYILYLFIYLYFIYFVPYIISLVLFLLFHTTTTVIIQVIDFLCTFCLFVICFIISSLFLCFNPIIILVSIFIYNFM